MKSETNNKYINREMSWLEFNKRVLAQADDMTVPLIERLHFYSIYISNLDEYMMVRVGCMQHRAIYDKSYSDDKTGLSANEILDAIYEQIRNQARLQYRIYNKLQEELKTRKFVKIGWNELEKAEKKQLAKAYSAEIKKKVSIYVLNQRHPFPHLENLRLHIAFRLQRKSEKGLNIPKEELISYGILPIPDEIPGIYCIEKDEETRYIFAYEMIARIAPELLKNYTVTDYLVFKITRNADIDFEDEFTEEAAIELDMPDKVRNVLKKRARLGAVRLEYYVDDCDREARIVKYLAKKLELDEKCIFRLNALVLKKWDGELADVVAAKHPELAYSPIPPISIACDGSLLDLLKKRDAFLSYPYNSFGEYLELLREAVYNRSTEAIKITLYRVSKYSEVVTLLKIAAERGINVTVAIELKARFDEESNAHWCDVLAEAGCRVIYGISGLKVHSKVTYIRIKEQDSVREYAHIGTGNYNEKTAKQYTDIGIMTANSEICGDCRTLFESLEEQELTDNYRRLLVSPTCLRSSIITEIRREIAAKTLGKGGYICMKMNSLTDKAVIDELYEAAASGVKIDLIIRGICCLRPCENINVISIVGRYLEHSRIYIFGENVENRRAYIGSADMMTRNTMRRVEVLTPVLDADIVDKLYRMTRLELIDTVKAAILKPNGQYEKKEPQGSPCDSQIEMYKLH